MDTTIISIFSFHRLEAYHCYLVFESEKEKNKGGFKLYPKGKAHMKLDQQKLISPVKVAHGKQKHISILKIYLHVLQTKMNMLELQIRSWRGEWRIVEAT